MAGPSFILTAADVITADQALESFGERLQCTRRHHDPESLGSAALRITAWIDPHDEGPGLAAYLGTERTLVVDFTPVKGLDSDEYARTVRRIVAAVAHFLHEYPGASAVLHEDTRTGVLLRRLGNGEVELDAHLRDVDGLNYSGAFNELTAEYSVAELDTLDP